MSCTNTGILLTPGGYVVWSYTVALDWIKLDKICGGCYIYFSLRKSFKCTKKAHWRKSPCLGELMRRCSLWAGYFRVKHSGLLFPESKSLREPKRGSCNISPDKKITKLYILLREELLLLLKWQMCALQFKLLRLSVCSLAGTCEASMGYISRTFTCFGDKREQHFYLPPCSSYSLLQTLFLSVLLTVTRWSQTAKSLSHW